MKKGLAAVACLTLVPHVAADTSKISAVQKVLQLMKNMLEKGKAEKAAEEVQYTKFSEFCKDTLAEKRRATDAAAEKIEGLEADVEKSETDAEQLSYEIQGHKKDVETASLEKDKATKVREKESSDYAVALQDYTESIEALARAIKQVKSKAFDRKQVSSFLQITHVERLKNKASLPAGLSAFLSESSDQPEADGYEFASGSIVDMLEELQTKFVQERVDLEKAEAAKKNAYAMLTQSLDAQVAQGNQDINQKTQFQAKKLQKKAAAGGDLDETKVARAADVKYSEDLEATCAQKKGEFSERQHIRHEELEAVERAIDVLKDGITSSLLQVKEGKASLASLRSVIKNKEGFNPAKVARFLQDQANSLNSHLLSSLAVRISEEQPAEDALLKVRQMIEGLITKLNDQAKEEATKKGYCDKELKTNEQTRTEKANAVDTLTADLEECKSTISQLAEEITALSQEVTALNEAMNKASVLRQKEKGKNNDAVRDSKEAQKAVASAIEVLQSFYAKASEAAASFLQTATTNHAGQPEIFESKPYTGMGGSKDGVIGMLEVIQSDYSREEAETQAAERAAAKEFSQFMEDSKVDKTKKEKDLEHKSAKKAEKSQEGQALDNDLHGTTKELDAANAYYEKLKPQCVNTEQSHADRQAQREEEIKDLQAALDMIGSLR
eukprot:TRINITY_DN23598_c0_g1_i1.p1 TRINITY_DN23598_c0_g1~~TRINITY_DN23598_c0_g1_i1.p1  ORF type:complete len:670 (-),score=238.19 TRINITY_DN23598_c0_g1_i1:255-2264(-)